MIIGIFGDKGSGKTLLCTILLKKAYDKGYKIYSNYKLNFNFEPITILKLAQLDFNNCIIGLDEAYNYLDARLSQTQQNIILSRLIAQSRKMKVHIIYTAQLMRTVDVRLRNLTDIIILAQKTKKGFEYTIFNSLSVKTFLLKNSVAKRFYNLYDTYEIIEDEVTQYKIKKFIEKMKKEVEGNGNSK